MKLESVKVGLVGLGLVSEAHIKAFLSHPGAEMVAVCDLDAQRAGAVAAKYGVRKIYTDYAEMLKDDEINLIDICTPTFLHTRMVIQAAEAGKNIQCEKPFCLTLADGERAIAAAKAHGVRLAVGESYRFMTSMMKARELIDAGEIGKPTQMRQRFGEWVEKNGVLDDRETTELHRGWRMNSERAGGNGFPWMFDHCVHFFTAAEYLMGESRINEVYAVMADNAWMHRESRDKVNLSLHGNDLGDITMITWSYEDPACKGVWMRAEEVNGKYDYMKGFSVIIIGDKGMIEVLGEGGSDLQSEGKDVHLVLHRKDGSVQTWRFDEGGDEIWQSDISYYSHAHINEIHGLVDSLLSGAPLPYSGEDGLRDVRTTLAAICSAREKLPVKVAEVTDARYLG
ncbi:MAG: Gfo/Idh/MocA family protein [Aristaeellaceae bacterium]